MITHVLQHKLESKLKLVLMDMREVISIVLALMIGLMPLKISRWTSLSLFPYWLSIIEYMVSPNGVKLSSCLHGTLLVASTYTCFYAEGSELPQLFALSAIVTKLMRNKSTVLKFAYTALNMAIAAIVIGSATFMPSSLVPAAVISSVCLTMTLTWLHESGVCAQLAQFEYLILSQGLGCALFQCIRPSLAVGHLVLVGELSGPTERALYMTSAGVLTVLIIGEMVRVQPPSLKWLVVVLGGAFARRWWVILDGRPDLVLCEFLFDASNHGGEWHQGATGLLLVIFFAAVLCITVPLSLSLSRRYKLEGSTSRKLFHVVAVGLFSTGLIVNSNMMVLAFGVALCGMLVLEYLRLIIPEWYLMKNVDSFYASFVDARDAERDLTLTHIQLLVGCALPVWLSCVDTSGAKLTPHLGWLSVGVLDGVSAAVGKNLGSHKWPGTNRTVEGSLAGVTSAIGLAWLVTMVEMDDSMGIVREASAAAVALLACGLVEAFTWDVDNVLLPLATVLVFNYRY